MKTLVLGFTCLIMTMSGVPSTVGSSGKMSLCKKWCVDHERPVGAKCKRVKAVVKDKKDTVKDVKKTPKNKSNAETLAQDKLWG